MPSPAPSIKCGGSSRSVPSATRKQLVKLVRTHFTREITPELRKRRSELGDRTAESLQSIKDNVEARLSAQSDAVLDIVQREASTRVESLRNDAKDDLAAELLATLQTEVPAMGMSLATSPPTRGEGRNTEDIPLLTQALEQENACVKILENRLETALNVRPPGLDLENNLTARDGGRRAKRRSRDRRQRDSESSDEDERASHRCSHDGDHRSRSRSSRSPSRDRLRDDRRHRRRRSSPSYGRHWQGPRMYGLKEITPGDPRFMRVLSYRTYRLRNIDGGRGPSVAYNTGVNTRRVAHVMESHVFDSTDPLSFLSRFKQQMDNNKLSEGAACLICPNFLASDAKEAYENNFELPEDEGGFNNWPEALQFLLKSYAKDRHIEEALASLEDIKQMPDEKESAYAKRLRTQARRCGGVFSEPEMITRFIRGLREDLKPLLHLTRADYSLPNVFQDFVERATAQGEAHRALSGQDTKPPKRREGVCAPATKPSLRATKTTVLSRGPQVYSVDPIEEHGDDLPYYPPGAAPHGADPVMALHTLDEAPSHVPTQELDMSETPTSEPAGPLSSEVYLVHPNRNPRQPHYEQPTSQQRPGWVAFRNEPTNICFECFETFCTRSQETQLPLLG